MKGKDIIEKSEKALAARFYEAEQIALYNQRKVLKAFRDNCISQTHLVGSTGYGYGDRGREKLNALYASVFNCEDAYVGTGIYSGTQALTIALFGVLRPNDIILSVSGVPYDTIHPVLWGHDIGSLADFGVTCDCIEPVNNDFDYDKIRDYLQSRRVRAIYIQRSRGYLWRNAFTIKQIEQVIAFAKSNCPSVLAIVDNCYGEFVETLEPTDVGADLAAGSLIKNMGGGLAPTGGYIVGKADLVKQCAGRATTPATNAETGSYDCGYRNYFQGVFVAPHVVLQAVKGALLFAECARCLGLKAIPDAAAEISDIVCTIEFENAAQVVGFCQAIQANSPIEGFVSVEPAYMPGYEDDVVMAAGCFVQGASIELSCDSPIRSPYIAYLQGGLTYEHVKIACEAAIESLLK
ncbi:MAG: methionine gamma-lyase family protein [Clostridia bacterium]|nr:methionine gamma-lyase family protein [Clostridia bacterium]